MSIGSDEALAPNDTLNEALVAFTGFIGEAVAGICSYGLTIGETYVPFRPDDEDECEDGEEFCSQVWVRVMGVTPQANQSWSGDCSAVLSLDIEVGVLRCFEIPEGGEAPTASDSLVAAMQAMDDMKAIYCAAMACEVWEAIEAGQWSPAGPLGGQYGGTWTFTVEV